MPAFFRAVEINKRAGRRQGRRAKARAPSPVHLQRRDELILASK